MLRRSFLVVPLLAGIAALVGASTGRPLLAGAAAAGAALVVELVVARTSTQRVDTVAWRVERLAAGEGTAAASSSGSRSWRRLDRALSAVDQELTERFEQLEGERTRVERLLEQLDPAVLLFTDERLVYANRSAKAMFALTEDSQGRTPIQVLGSRAFADAVREAAESAAAVQVELEQDGEVLAGQAGVTAEGEVALVVTDLSEQRRVEAMRRDFVINASHELKTPAAAVQALAESLALAVEQDPARAQSMIDRLGQEASRLTSLVRELLDLARLEEGLARWPEPVDLAAMARMHVERLASSAEARQVTIQADCPEPAVVVGLREDLRLVVANLLSNAVGYNRPGGDVLISVHKSGGQVVLEVSDTGLGIAEADIPRVFERFYRVDPARSRAAGGTGLGLSIVRHAVQRHGGDITVRSVLGQGSTFRVALPVEGVAYDGRPAGTPAA